MEKKDHITMISIFIIIALLSLITTYNNPTGNVSLDTSKLILTNCIEEDNWRTCDVQYSEEIISKKAYKEKINVN